MTMIRNEISMYMLNKADELVMYRIYNGKKTVTLEGNLDPYYKQWMVQTESTKKSWGYVPEKKTVLLEALNIGLIYSGQTAKDYDELIMKKNGEIIAVYSNYEFPEALKARKVAPRKVTPRKNTTHKSCRK